jgi:hypothetical protein
MQWAREPREEVRVDGSVHMIEGCQFFHVNSAAEIVRSDQDLDEMGLSESMSSELRRRFDGFEAQAAKQSASEVDDEEALRALRALGYTK